MSYIKADEVLPQHIIKIIQQYIDGENIYYRDYVNGATVAVLAGRYYLSDKTIQRIIREMRINESV